MIFPNITDYKNAIKTISQRTDNLQNLVPVNLDNKNIPIGSAGRFATVFKMKDSKTNKFFALKCFTRESKDRKERYEKISDFLNSLNSLYFCEYKYLDKEFWITPSSGNKEEAYPVVKMEWVTGRTLGIFLNDTKNKNLLNKLFENWVELSKFLYQNEMAHGDLKHDNMIISDSGEITLIDYDGMFVPTLAGKEAFEEGSPNYQHLKRDSSKFDKRIDYFPMLVIAISIKALANSPELLKKYGTGENILFLKKDFENLNNSKLMKDLRKINDADLQDLLSELEIAVDDFDYVPSFLAEKKEVITKTNPQYFIFNIDSKSRIDKGKGELYQRIKEIIAQRLFDLNEEISDKDSVLYSIIEHNWSKKIDNSKSRKISKIDNLKNIFVSSEKTRGFNSSVILIENKLNDFQNQFPKGQKPIVINILANKQFSKFKIFYSADIYNIYISDVDYKPLIKYPVLPDSQNNFYKDLFESSSKLDKFTKNFLEQKYRENLSNDAKGVILNSNDVITYKFLDSILLSRFL
jgi:hypothetical protein